VRALAWWGCAYLLGGFAVGLWSAESQVSWPLPIGSANALLFIACGMVWNAARIFHARPILWGALAAGATTWLIACLDDDFTQSVGARIVLSSMIVSTYTFLTAAELWRERRKEELRRCSPALLVPILHGAVFLVPIPIVSMSPSESGLASLASGWIAVFVLEVLLYIVGSAFIVLALSKERTVRILRNAATTDELSGLLNRRGFLQAADTLIAGQIRRKESVTVLMFDLDHFKKINDRFGHAIGDEALRLFSATAKASTRTSDIVGRLGGEEFAAILPSAINDALIVAERGVMVAGCPLAATVSIGAACTSSAATISALLASADAALYRAKESGRNRIVCADEAMAGTEPATGKAADKSKPAAGAAAVARAA
jgi:diguanylate cyclase (GGDEF)-like protein